MKFLLCVSQFWNSAAKKTCFANGVSSLGTLGSSSPLRIHFPIKKTRSSQDFTGSYYLQNSHLEQLRGSGHSANEALNQRF